MPTPDRRRHGDIEFALPRRVAIGRIPVALLFPGTAAGGAAK